MSAARGAVLGALALVLAGCGIVKNTKEMMGLSSDARPPAKLTEFKATVVPRAAWTANVGKAGTFLLHPEASAGRVYAVNAQGQVTVLEEESGRVAARFEAKRPISGGLALGEGTLIGGTMKGDVLAFDLTGKLLWATNVSGDVIAPAAISRKTAVVRTSDGRIFGLSLADGKRQWVYQRPSPALLLRTDAGVIAQGGDVVAGYSGGKLIALDLDDGKLTWEVTVMLPRGSTELERISDVAGVPVLDAGRVCAGAFQGKVACFEVQTRNMLWSRDISTARSLAVDASNLYVVDDSGNVHALNKSSGASVWKQDKLLNRRLTAPLLVNGNIVVGDGYGFLHVLAAADGALIGRLATDGTAVNALLTGTSGVLLQTAGGSVVMVRF